MRNSIRIFYPNTHFLFLSRTPSVSDMSGVCLCVARSPARACTTCAYPLTYHVRESVWVVCDCVQVYVCMLAMRTLHCRCSRNGPLCGPTGLIFVKWSSTCSRHIPLPPFAPPQNFNEMSGKKWEREYENVLILILAFQIHQACAHCLFEWHALV